MHSQRYFIGRLAKAALHDDSISKHRRVLIRSVSSLKACVIGAGPAGYYTAQRLLKSDIGLKVDIVDKLPVPFGLVRFGVAPDHPEVKNVINTFTQTATKYTDRCRFIGNVEVGKDIHTSELLSSYDIVVLSYGAEHDRKLNIPGESSNGVYSAREFVGWYNGLPEFAHLAPDLSGKTAVILGQGNVALDIARLLLMPIDELEKTDICQHALDMIAASKLKNIHIVGRRGPLQAAFTIKELREMTKLPNVQSHIAMEDFKNITIADLPRPRRRITELMLKVADSQQLVNSSIRSWNLKFLLTPKEIITNDNIVSGVRFLKNKLEGHDIESQKAVPTVETLDIPCDLVIRSIGYQSLAITAHDDIPFDDKTCTIPNNCGRVLGKPGVYCSGWAKRGPVGVIATTMSDAFETADSVLDDIKSGVVTASAMERQDIMETLQNTGGNTVDFSEWQNIDREEMERGEKKGKPREKIVDVREMLQVAKS